MLTIPGIVIDKKVFEVVEKLLKNFNEITIFFKTWKERWLFRFLELFNENQDLKETTNEETKIAISILKNENFVGKLISLKVSEVLSENFQSNLPKNLKTKLSSLVSDNTEEEKKEYEEVEKPITKKFFSKY